MKQGILAVVGAVGILTTELRLLFGRDVLEDQEAVDIAKLAMAAWQVANGANASVPYSSAVTIQESIEKVAAEKLIKEALAKGSLDNITVVVVVLPWE